MSAAEPPQGENSAPAGGSTAREPDGPPRGRTPERGARSSFDPPQAWGDHTSADADRPLLDAQIAYYRARAPEYDAWWSRTGRFDRGEDNNAAWRSEAAMAEAAVIETLESTRPSNVLEFACGTGLFTRHIAPRVDCATAVDASPEVIAINRHRVAADNVRYVQADLFAYEPEVRYDCVFMSFWLSHVPRARFDSFWSTVRRALAPGGFAYVLDSAHDPTSTAADHPAPDRHAGIVTRRLDDGREYRIVKVFWEPAALNNRLRECGFDADIRAVGRYFIHGTARERKLGSEP